MCLYLRAFHNLYFLTLAGLKELNPSLYFYQDIIFHKHPYFHLNAEGEYFSPPLGVSNIIMKGGVDLFRQASTRGHDEHGRRVGVGWRVGCRLVGEGRGSSSTYDTMTNERKRWVTVLYNSTDLTLPQQNNVSCLCNHN